MSPRTGRVVLMLLAVVATAGLGGYLLANLAIRDLLRPDAASRERADARAGAAVENYARSVLAGSHDPTGPADGDLDALRGGGPVAEVEVTARQPNLTVRVRIRQRDPRGGTPPGPANACYAITFHDLGGAGAGHVANRLRRCPLPATPSPERSVPAHPSASGPPS